MPASFRRPRGPTRCGVRRVHVKPDLIASVGTGDHREHRGRVDGVARDGPDRRGGAGGKRAEPGTSPPVGWTPTRPEYAAGRRDVRHHRSRSPRAAVRPPRRRRSGAGYTGRAGRVPGVARRGLVVKVAVITVDGHARVPHDQRPRTAQPLHDEVVMLGDAGSEGECCGRPSISRWDLTAIGIPWSGPRSSPASYRGLRRFRVRTRPLVEVVERPEDTLVSSIRPRKCSSISTGDTSGTGSAPRCAKRAPT